MKKWKEKHWTGRTVWVVKCHCGEEIVCDKFTNTCPRCEADYDMKGNRLAPRKFWGEETGEHWTECY